MAPGSSWNVYLASKDLDHTRTEVGRLGGRVVMGPVPAGEDGRLCLAVDPSGAAVGFWEGGRDEGVVLVDEPGALRACELHTARPGAAEEFYRGLYGDVPLVIRPSSRTGWVPFFGVSEIQDTGATEDAGNTGSEGKAGSAGTAAAAPAAGARPLGSNLFADPLGAIFGLTSGN